MNDPKDALVMALVVIAFATMMLLLVKSLAKTERSRRQRHREPQS